MRLIKMFSIDRQISSSQWKKFIEAGRLLPSSSERFQMDLWKGEIRERSRSTAPHESSPSSPKKAEHKKLNTTEPGKRVKVYAESDAMGGRPVKGVPASFGYVKKSSEMKRSDSSAAAKSPIYKTANVTSVAKLMDTEQSPVSLLNNRSSLERQPKTKLKVSGGTQTDLGGTPPRTIKPSAQYQANGSYSDSEYQTPMKFSPAGSGASAQPATTTTTFKSYSLTAPIANQLSHNVRERLLNNNGTQSLPKSHLNHLKGTFLHSH